MAALLMGGLATWLTAGWLDRTAQATARTRTPGIGTTDILVANVDLKPGDIVRPGMLVWQEWPQASVRPEYLARGGGAPSAYAGAMVRVGVARGQPVLAAHFVKRGEQGVMAALIAPGFRAISIPVTAASGLAGFVGPGDRVDILLTATLRNGGRVLGQLVAANVRVLAIDQRIEPVSAAVLGERRNGSTTAPSTVTLEVTPRQAERLAVAQELGRLSLALRDLQAQGEPPAGADDDRSGGKDGQTWDSDVTRLPATAAMDAGGEALGAAAAAAAAAAPVAGTGHRPRAAARGAVEVVRGGRGDGDPAALPPAPPVGEGS